MLHSYYLLNPYLTFFFIFCYGEKPNNGKTVSCDIHHYRTNKVE